MGKSEVRVSTRVRAPIDSVFADLTDPETMRSWPGVKRCDLIVEGSPRNGVGAVRRITAGGVTVDEKVVRFEPPTRCEYTIVRGLPVKHLGSLQLSAHGDDVAIDWCVTIESRVPLFAQIMGGVLKRGLRRVLVHFKRTVEG